MTDLSEREAIRKQVHHLADEHLTHWQVSTQVNRAVEDGPELIEPIG